MKRRDGFVANSSSSSFIVALRKGHTWGQVIEDAGAFGAFAKELIDFVAKQIGPLESIQNVELAYAIKCNGEYVDHAKIVEGVKAGEWDFVENACKKIVANPQEWMFGRGSASYNDGDAIEIWLGYGGEIDGENFKVKGVPN